MPALNTTSCRCLWRTLLRLLRPSVDPRRRRSDVMCQRRRFIPHPPINNRVAFTLSMKKQEEEWVRPGVFDPANLGPWAILIVVLLFEGINLASRLGVPLPSFIQALIPLVLGCQYDGSCGS